MLTPESALAYLQAHPDEFDHSLTHNIPSGCTLIFADHSFHYRFELFWNAKDQIRSICCTHLPLSYLATQVISLNSIAWTLSQKIPGLHIYTKSTPNLTFDTGVFATQEIAALYPLARQAVAWIESLVSVIDEAVKATPLPPLSPGTP